MSDRRRTGRERRRTPRVPAVFAVREATAEAVGVALGQAEDLALGGITIRHPVGVVRPPATPVVLSFELPDSREEIAARGVVVSDTRVGSFRRTGVRFLALRPEHAQAIAAFCRRASPTPMVSATASVVTALAARRRHAG